MASDGLWDVLANHEAPPPPAAARHTSHTRQPTLRPAGPGQCAT